MKQPDRGRGRKSGGGVAGGKRRGVGERDHRLNRRIREGRARALRHVLQHHRHTLGDRRSSGDGHRSCRQPAPPGVAAAAGHREERPLDPPRRSDHEERGEGPPMDAVEPLESDGV